MECGDCIHTVQIFRLNKLIVPREQYNGWNGNINNKNRSAETMDRYAIGRYQFNWNTNFAKCLWKRSASRPQHIHELVIIKMQMDKMDIWIKSNWNEQWTTSTAKQQKFYANPIKQQSSDELSKTLVSYGLVSDKLVTNFTANSSIK